MAESGAQQPPKRPQDNQHRGQHERDQAARPRLVFRRRLGDSEGVDERANHGTEHRDWTRRQHRAMRIPASRRYACIRRKVLDIQHKCPVRLSRPVWSHILKRQEFKGDSHVHRSRYP